MVEPHVADHRPLPGTARPRPPRRPPPRPPPHPPPRSHPRPSALLQLYCVYKSVHIFANETCVRQYKDCVSGFSENVSGVDLDGDALAEAILLECGVNPPPTHEGSFSFTAEYWCTRAYESIWEVPVLVPAMLSAAMRVGTYVKIYLASTRVFGEGLRLPSTNMEWSVPADLRALIGAEARGAIVRMVKRRAQHRRRNDADDDADVSKRGGGGPRARLTVAAALLPAARAAAARTSCRTAPATSAAPPATARPAAAPPSGSCSSRLASSCSYACSPLTAIRTLRRRWSDVWRRRGRPASLGDMTSGRRFVQMSADLSTLRWSWSDYILLHEIVRIDERSEDNSIT